MIEPSPDNGSVTPYSDIEYVFEPNSMAVPPAREYVRDVWERRGFILELARASLRGTRSSTLIGELWGLLDPLFQAAIYIFLVAVLRGGAGKAYLAMVVSGVFLFNVTRIALTVGGRSIRNGRNLMLNSTFPRALLPLSSVYRGILEFMPSAAIYAILHIALGQPIGSGLLMLPILFVLQVLMSTGFALLFAALTVYVRDVLNLLDYIIRILFFTTPVIYPVSSLSPVFKAVLSINPFFALFSAYQAIIAGGVPTAGMLVQVLLWTMVSLVLGYRVFVSLERSFALRL